MNIVFENTVFWVGHHLKASQTRPWVSVSKALGVGSMVTAMVSWEIQFQNPQFVPTCEDAGWLEMTWAGIWAGTGDEDCCDGNGRF